MAAVRPKSLLYIVRRTPYESLRPLETIDAILVAAVFELAVAVLFIDDGVWQLTDGQATAAGTKNIARQLGVLPGYDIESVWACEESLAERNLKVTDLCLPVQSITRQAQQALITDHELVFND